MKQKLGEAQKFSTKCCLIAFMFIMSFSWLVDNSYLCLGWQWLRISPQARWLSPLSCWSGTWRWSEYILHITNLLHCRSDWDTSTGGKGCVAETSVLLNDGAWLFQQSYKPMLLNQPQSHFVICFREARDLARPQWSGRGVQWDHCQRQRSALRLQQLSSNRSRVCSRESNAQFLLAKIQLLLTRKHHLEQSSFTAGWWTMGAVCPTAIGRETPATQLPFACCLQETGKLFSIPQAERQCTRQQQLK